MTVVSFYQISTEYIDTVTFGLDRDFRGAIINAATALGAQIEPML